MCFSNLFCFKLGKMSLLITDIDAPVSIRQLNFLFITENSTMGSELPEAVSENFQLKYSYLLP